MDAVYRAKFQQAKQQKGGAPAKGLKSMPSSFEGKINDPLIRAETERKIGQQRQQLQQEYQKEKELLDQEFERQK